MNFCQVFDYLQIRLGQYKPAVTRKTPRQILMSDYR